MDTGHTPGTVRGDPGDADSFGLTLRRLRERAGLTQEQLAERAGISANAVSSLERGTRRRPYPHTRDALARALGITADERTAWEGRLSPRGQPPRLPSASSALLGRDRETAIVIRLLSADRVVTLTGPGGVGKTRLAMAAAEQVVDRFPDGAAFVSLDAVRDAGDVLPSVARELGLRELGPRDLPRVLATYLRTRRMLLVLDNVEHVLDAAPEIAGLVAAAPGLAVLATSRAPMRIRGERVHPVPVLEPAAAADLFAERARQAGGVPIDGDPAVITELCVRLDHLPLAIELAAARTRLLTPAQLLGRLDVALSTTAAVPRDAPPRQQTLRDTVRWSYELLPPPAQTLLRQIAVFSGGWTLSAATELGDLDEVEALNLLHTLLDNSLIDRDATSAEPRFSILETVRAFALEHLAASGLAEQARDEHARLFGERAASAGSRLWSTAQVEALDDLESDHDNVRSALRHLLDRGRLDDLAAACYGSWLFWLVRGHLRDPLAWVDAALATATVLGPMTVARLQFVAGWMLLPRGDYDEAVRRFWRAAHLAEEAAADITRCWILVAWAHAEVYRGRPDTAAALLATSADLARRHGIEHAASCVVIGEAHVALASGSMAAAEALLREHLPAIEARGAEWPLAVALGVQGRVVSVLGDHERADALLRRAVRIFGRLDDTWGMAHQLTHVADVAALRGDHTRAALLYGAVDALGDQVGVRVFHIWQELSDTCQAATMTTLGVERCTDLRQRGRRLAKAEVVDLAAGSPIDADGPVGRQS